ncbi:MAG: TetR/AcrR family transcriptional regulator [Microscillaceae bacterium]|nr:TetR/AcrR family transcriptional regulator [Microscillaceae bacterium]
MLVDSETLLKRLKKVFRTYGYEGTTLSILEEHVGLKKASLYHRFPGGKKEMATYVLDEVGKWVDENVVSVCYGDLPKEQKLLKVLDKTYEMYEGGDAACLWRVFSLGESLEMFQTTVEKQIRCMIKAIAHLFEEFGENKDIALRKSTEFMITIQGRLVMVSAMNDVSYFRDYLEEFKHEMLG